MVGKAESEWPGLSGKAKRFAIVASRFNAEIVERLVAGAKRAFRDFGVSSSDVDIFWCPGALEIPALAHRVARQVVNGAPKYHGIVCCGAVVRGETDHYHFVAAEAMHGVSQLAYEANVAVGNAILTVGTVAQALARSEESTKNKGYEAAVAALVMAKNFEQLL
ncbi:MAG: 6,7-dimethyl-8-ribityllumazine synthase [Candidatus Sumerlaeaceae bacterium]|jgi:6,7-dimethyl-8-ribityllumazine synthase